MANKRVSLVRKCKTPDGWKRYPVVMAANGRVKTDTVRVAGVEATFPVGHYELGSYAGSKRVWTKVKGNASNALAALKNAQKIANAVATADDAGVEMVVDPKRTLLRDAHPRFVAAAVARGSHEAAEIYDRTLKDFLAGCKKTYAEELTHDDILKFHGQMRGRGLSPRTVSNRHMNLRAFLLSLGFEAEKLKKIAGGKAPKFEKTMPEIFEKDDLRPFFASLGSDYDRLLFDVLLTTGLREREAMHLEFVDLNHARKTLQVRSKPRYKHKIKDAEEREMPLTVNLIKQLKDYRAKHPNARLVFGKRGGEVDEPDGHLLRRLKALARDAGLNCGVCGTCVTGKGQGRECERWFLHKFRATYITTLLRSGLDLRTVMKLSGHSDLASVMRYLRPAEGAEVQDRVNSITWR
jgi:integrase